LLCASSAVGSEGCVYPDRLDAKSIESYAKQFDHRVVVSAQRMDLDSVEVVPLDSLVMEAGDLPPQSDRAPVMILTTGTTGRQRAARHDWARLVGAATHTDTQPGARWLLAYNLNQFAGVQVVLHVLASRATLVVAHSNQPREAVAVMRELGVTHVSATPTFWRFVATLLDETTASEIRLEQITLGGEAVPARLLERLGRLFPKARISQVYGATEFGLGISVRDRQAGLPLSVLERGDDADVQMRIVDGELYVRSRVGMIGYYGESDNDADWRPTGDLVEVRRDRIAFVGRTSEIINVGGVKVHPLPVEEIVESIAGVELVRAYGHSNPVTGQIVAVDVVAASGVDTEDLGDEIRTACATLAPAARPRRIRFVDSLEVRGHKIARGRDATKR
jgi:acyl-coenzyme A synthetase/AMP-(fatty) acid ligase